jgi:hypothetical protein
LYRRAAAPAFAAAVLVLLAPAARAAPAYQPPVDGPLVDQFRPPQTRYGPGNRGVDYATAPGTPVAAAGAGTVVFAGQVGGTLHVVVLHADGVRTSYSFLSGVSVVRGEQVAGGQTVGVAGATLHFGARVGDSYIDPLTLFAHTAPRARLLPDDGRGLPAEVDERRGLERLLRTLRAGGKATAAAMAWVGERAIDPRIGVALSAASAAAAARLDQGDCTPITAPTPPPPTGRRIAVLVGGLGSSTGNAAIRRLPTAALGYQPADVVQFSYATSQDRPYGPADTQIHPAAAGRGLNRALAELAARNPGVPIDVFAHSLGGLVARAALTDSARPPPPEVGHLVTFASPHGGADLAALVVAGRTTAAGRTAVALTEPLRPLGLAATAASLADLAPGSPFLEALAARSPPAHIRVTSIGARHDVVVPAGRTRLKGAGNVVVMPLAANAHDGLPGSAAAQREAALALADRPPTCQRVLDAAIDALVASSIQTVEAAAVGSVERGGLP